MDRYFDRMGMPIEMEEWAQLFEKDNRIVKQTRHKERGREFWLSTVWLGLNHNFGEGRPLIYETMAVEYKPKWNDVIASREEWMDWQERYSTEDEALAKRDPWQLVTEYKPDIIKLFVDALKGGNGE